MALFPGLFPAQQDANYYPPAPAASQSFLQRLTNPNFLQALSGFASGNTVGDQFANVNNILAGQQQKAQTLAADTTVRNKTVAMLQTADPELANAVAAGAMTPADALNAHIKKQQEAAVAAKPQFQKFDDGSYGWVNPSTQKVDIVGTAAKPDIPGPAKETKYWLTHPDEWTAYQQQRASLKDANDNTFEGRNAIATKLGLDPNDANTKQYLATGKFPKEDQQTLTAIDKKAIQEADDMVAMNEQAIDALKSAKGISDKANSGMLADTRASIGANLPDWLVPDQVSSPESSTATLDYNNAIIGQALGQLKAIFGGNPTEGERAILLQLQGSANVPAEARNKILDRALEAAQRRLDYNKNKADDLRGGSYYKPGRDATPAQPNNAGKTTTGLNWSVEP